MSFKRGVAVLGFKIGMVSATDGSDINTVSPVGYYTLDNGTQTAIADVTPTFKGNGEWAFDLLGAELDGSVIGLTFTHTVGITVHFTIKTVTKEVADLQDIAVTDIITNGAIGTLGGAVLEVASVTGAITLPTMPTNWMTNLGIAAGAMDDKGNWNVGKTNYVLAQPFPPNFEDLDISVTAGEVSVGTNNDKLGYSSAGTIANLDGLQDVSAADVKAQVVEAINVDTYGEPPQGTPGEIVPLTYKWGLIYKTLVNEKSFDGTTINMLNYAATVTDHKRSASQVAGTYTEENIVTGL